MKPLGPYVAVMMLAAVGLDAATCAAARVKWWRSDAAIAQLVLSSEQIDGIERIFEQTRSERLRLQNALDRAESELSRAIERDDYPAAEALVPRVEAARAAHNIARTRMLITMYRLLTTDQRAKLEALPGASRGPLR